MSTCDDLLCNACSLPGRCCTGFHLNISIHLETPLHALVWAATRWHGGPDGENEQTGLPFMPLWRKEGGPWVWWCPNLTREGRCGDYEGRPQLCRDYKAGSDPLCVMHQPAPTPELETVQ